jgi:hypothetical protein
VEILVCEVFVLGKKIINKMLRLCEKIIKKPVFDPFISIPGVNNNINTVNITKSPLYFHSRHDNLYLKGVKIITNVNNEKLVRRGLGSQC